MPKEPSRPIKRREGEIRRVLRGRLVAHCKTPSDTALAVLRERQNLNKEQQSRLAALPPDMFRAMMWQQYMLEQCHFCGAHDETVKPLFRATHTKTDKRAVPNDAAALAKVHYACGKCLMWYADTAEAGRHRASCVRCMHIIFPLEQMGQIYQIGYCALPLFCWPQDRSRIFYCNNAACVAWGDEESTSTSDSDSSDQVDCVECGDTGCIDDFHIDPTIGDAYCPECFQKSPYRVCDSCEDWVDTDDNGDGPLKRLTTANGKVLALCDHCYEARASKK